MTKKTATKALKRVATAEQLARIREWGSITGKKMLFYHNDPDGITAAAQWMAAFQDFEPIAREGPIMNPSFVRWVADQDPDVLVFLDLPVDQEAKKLEWMQKRDPELRIIIIDHHIPEKDIGSKNTVHINNKFVSGLKEKYLPASFLVYQLLVDLGKDLKQMRWIAGAGIIGDYGQKDCASFFKGIKGKMKYMDKAADLMSAAVTLKGRKGADRVLKILLRIIDQDDGVKGMDEFLKRKTLLMWKRFVDNEVKQVLAEFRKEKEEFKDLNIVFFRLKSKLNIVSVISTLLSEKQPKRVFVIYKLSTAGRWKASGRLQDGKLDLGTLFKKAVHGIGTGGGHRQAAGARVNDWDKFKRRVVVGLGQAKANKGKH